MDLYRHTNKFLMLLDLIHAMFSTALVMAFSYHELEQPDCGCQHVSLYHGERTPENPR
jgi:hypothetical protein